MDSDFDQVNYSGVPCYFPTSIAKKFALVFDAYVQRNQECEISHIGFHSLSGYAFIELADGTFIGTKDGERLSYPRKQLDEFEKIAGSSDVDLYQIPDVLPIILARKLAAIFKAYAENELESFLEQIGYNIRSGYAFICLGNRINICSKDGEHVVYLTTDLRNEEEEDAELEEFFFDNYHDALKKNEELNVHLLY
jgi:hypothetical protein